jgi:hypothetical protein
MTIQFSAQPGCRERHLRRKYANPLFGDDAQALTADDVERARREDEAEREQFRADFQDLLRRAADLSGQVETEAILEIKEQIDRLYELAAGLGGGVDAEQQSLLKINDVIMRAIHAAAANDPLAIEELEKEAAARQMHLELLRYPLVADLLRTDSPVSREDLVPTLLSEDAETVRVVISMFDPTQQAELRDEARALVEEFKRRDELPESALASLAAMQAVH